ncbi:MAG TPA: rhomboid family intramembrane serine protease [Solirubrobacteraceae bacterium]|nr:rhomboid family intramembrane serine protease [Solirubrobacteraceae bacterium]
MAERLGSDRTNALLLVSAMVTLMWMTEIVDQIGFGDLDSYGIHPRDVGGLPEIVSAPFLHVGFGHLISNTVPFLVMGAAIALGGLVRVAAVTVIVTLISGLGTWLIASSDSVHLGASGVVFGYATYLVSRGLLSRRLTELAVGALVVVIWGVGLLQGLLPQERISWQAHLFGAIGGVVAALLFAKRGQDDRAPAAV